MATATNPATKNRTTATKNAAKHMVEELEDQFHSIQSKISKARDNYVASHQKELSSARKKMKAVQAQFTKTKAKAAKAAVHAGKTSSRTAADQLKKTRAASLLLGKSLQEAKNIMLTAESKLHAAKPFDRKLAARAKLLLQFEKDWEKKLKAEAVARASRAKKAAVKRKAAKEK
jgi:hypothetical protein